MALTQNSDAATKQIAGILAKAEAVLEDVFAYYKFGRHESAPPEKGYFLLSHCSHLLFLLWQTEQDNGGTIFQETRRPAALQTDLDFGTLRCADYTRRMLGADSIEEHLKNEPQWFRFWLQLLDRLSSSGSATYHEFSRHVLTQVEQHSFLDAENRRKSKRKLLDLMKTDAAGYLLLHSVLVLEDLVWILTAHFAKLDPRHHIVELVLSLICLLGRIRQIIICEMPATGPCTLRDGRRWAMPSLSCRLYSGRTQGILKVILKREGGSALCTYDWMSGSAQRSQSWTVKTSALSGSYEESLFKTWPCDVNDLRREGAGPSWVLQSVEAHHLETISHYADALLHTLRRNPLCNGLAEAVAGVVRNNHATWKPMRLPWIRIRQLDQVLAQLKSLCREVTVAGDDNAAERLVSQIWPVQRQVTEMVNPHVSSKLQDEPPSAVPIAPPETVDAVVHGTIPLSIVTKTADRSEPTPSADAVVPLRLAVQVASNQQVPPDLTIQPHQDVERTYAPDEKREEAPTPACRIDDLPACSKVNPPLASGEEHRSDLSEEHPREESTVAASPMVACRDGAPDRPPQEPAAMGQEARRQRSRSRVSRAAAPCGRHTDATRSLANKTGGLPIPPSQGDGERQSGNVTSTPNENLSATGDHVLVQELLQHHQRLRGPARYTPVSLVQLQQRLQWSRARVQRAMNHVFGGKPFHVYREKCKDHTISTFLQGFAVGSSDALRADVPAVCVSR